jgi:diguanylate cyclase (GGDEF)-like protein/PAS domain S-box-containing protein
VGVGVLVVQLSSHLSGLFGRRRTPRSRIDAEHLSTRAEEAERLLGAAARLNASVDPDEVLAQILELARDLVGAAHLSLLTNDGGRLRVRRYWRDGAPLTVSADPPPDDSIAHWVVDHQQTYRATPSSSIRSSGPTAREEEPQLAVPLFGHDGAVKVVIVVYRRRDGLPVDDRDQRLLEALARHAAIALERAVFTTQLRQSEVRFRSLVQQASDLIAVIDRQHTLRYVSPSAERLLQYPPSVLIGAPIERFIHPDDVTAFIAAFVDRQPIAGPATARATEFRMRCRNGSWCNFEAVVTNLLDEPGVAGFVLNAHDVTERKALEEALMAQAYSDALTGLANRIRFQQALQAALSPDRGDSGVVAVLFLDLDGFKLINDSFGHVTGDRLLAAVAERLKSSLSGGEAIARFGGDEFAVLLDPAASAGEAVRTGERLLTALHSPLHVDGRTILITASMGIAFRSPSDAAGQPEDLLREADIALYQAKAAGKDRAVLYESRMGTLAVRRLELENDLRLALQREEFRLYFQPIVDLKTGTIIGSEALLRWAHPRRGLLAPAEFLPVAEETGLIAPLGRWALERACRQAKAWNDRWPGGAHLDMSVNLSAVQLEQADLVDDVRSVLARTGLPPANLQLELTETAMLRHAERAGRQLAALKGMGVRLAIDDFGTGYSSLSYLQRLEVDCLKIDRSFLQDLQPDSPSVAIIRAIVALAAALKTDVTAEGLERSEQVALVRSMGCRYGQGFYFADPVPERLATVLFEPSRRSRVPAVPASA